MIPFMGETVCRVFSFVFISMFLLLLYIYIYICTVIIIMPRNYTRKSERGIAKPDEMLPAV